MTTAKELKEAIEWALEGIDESKVAHAILRAHLATLDERANENLSLRRHWWLTHGHFAALYGDDGEMQCGVCMADFKRDDPETLVRKMQRVPRDMPEARALIEKGKEGKAD